MYGWFALEDWFLGSLTGRNDSIMLCSKAYKERMVGEGKQTEESCGIASLKNIVVLELCVH